MMIAITAIISACTYFIGRQHGRDKNHRFIYTAVQEHVRLQGELEEAKAKLRQDLLRRQEGSSLGDQSDHED